MSLNNACGLRRLLPDLPVLSMLRLRIYFQRAAGSYVAGMGRKLGDFRHTAAVNGIFQQPQP